MRPEKEDLRYFTQTGQPQPVCRRIDSVTKVIDQRHWINSHFIVDLATGHDILTLIHYETDSKIFHYSNETYEAETN